MSCFHRFNTNKTKFVLFFLGINIQAFEREFDISLCIQSESTRGEGYVDLCLLQMDQVSILVKPNARAIFHLDELSSKFDESECRSPPSTFQLNKRKSSFRLVDFVLFLIVITSLL